MATIDSDKAEILRRRLDEMQGGPSLGDQLLIEGARQLQLPGAYARGALAGRLGEKATSEEMLGRSLGPIGRLGWDLATDPLTYVGPGLAKAAGPVADALRMGGRALGEGPAANPLVNAMTKFAGGESGALDWNVFAGGLRNPEERALLRSIGPEDYFARQGIPYAEVPARKLEVLGERMDVPVAWKGRGDVSSAYASFHPETGRVELPRTMMWAHPERMASEVTGLGSGPTPWVSTADPMHLGTHEMLHALQHREAPDLMSYLRRSGGMIDPERAGWLGRNVSQLARMNPHEAIAEIGAKKVLTPEALIKPPVQRMWDEYGGPHLEELRRAINLR